MRKEQKVKSIFYVLAIFVFVFMFAVMPVQAAPKTKLSAKKVTMAATDTKVVILKNAKSKVKWTTTNKKVVSIKASGKKKQKVKITAKKAGVAKVKAKCGGKTYTIKVTVKDVSLNTSNITISTDESVDLKLYNVTKDVVWQSSNEDIACVDISGDKNEAAEVLAVNEGVVTVTATYNKKVYNCNITVTDDSQSGNGGSSSITGSESGGDDEDDDEDDDTPHTHVWKILDNTEPTCTEEGSTQYACFGCGEQKFEITEAFGHTPSEYFTTDTYPSCVKEGSKSHHCLTCNEPLDSETIEALDHNYDPELEEEIVELSCTVDGLIYNYCTRCGEKKETILEHPGHEMAFVETGEVATCERKGFDLYACQNEYCDYTESREVPAKGHIEPDEDQWDITLKEGCTTTGKKQKVCQREGCGKVLLMADIPATGHDPYAIKTEVVKESVCDEERNYFFKQSKRNCLDAESFDITVTTEEINEKLKEDNLSDTLDNRQKTEMAIYDEKANAYAEENGYIYVRGGRGIAVKFCTDCNSYLTGYDSFTFTKEISHDFEFHSKKSVLTCISDEVHNLKCKNCGKFKEKLICTAATGTVSGNSVAGHQYVEDYSQMENTIVDKKATCTENGYKVLKCLKEYAVYDTDGNKIGTTKCPSKMEIEPPAKGHTWQRETVKINGVEETVRLDSVSQNGFTQEFLDTLEEGKKYKLSPVDKVNCVGESDYYMVCIDCGEKILYENGEEVVKQVVGTGHEYDESTAVVIQQPCCTATGLKKVTCVKCNGSKEESIPKTNHTLASTYTTLRASTCKVAGEQAKQCTVCRGFYANTALPLAEHTKSFGRCTVCKTACPGFYTDAGVYVCSANEFMAAMAARDYNSSNVELLNFLGYKTAEQINNLQSKIASMRSKETFYFCHGANVTNITYLYTPSSDLNYPEEVKLEAEEFIVAFKNTLNKHATDIPVNINYEGNTITNVKITARTHSSTDYNYGSNNYEYFCISGLLKKNNTTYGNTRCCHLFRTDAYVEPDSGLEKLMSQLHIITYK